MLVKDLMSWPVVSVFDNSTVGEALDLIKRKKIRHLPVIDFNQLLLGIVTETDMVKVFPNAKESSPFQLNLLSRTPISKIMVTNPLTVSPNNLIEEAALVMRNQNIGCLPVLDENKKLAGLLAKNDIIDAFVSSLGLEEEGTRITVAIKKRWGFLSELISFADKHNVHIQNFVTFNKEIVLKLREKSPEFVNELRKAGYNVTNISNITPIKKLTSSS